MHGDGYITNVYDGEGRMIETSLRNSGNSVLNSHNYGYNAASQRTVVTNTAGNYMEYAYDSIGQLKMATGKSSGGSTRVHDKFGYAYDDRGNLLRKTNVVQVLTFTNGAYNQLASATRSGTFAVVGMTSTNASSVTVSANGGSALPATLVSEDNSFYRSVSWSSGNNTYVANGTDAAGRTSTDTVTSYLPLTGIFLYDLNGNLTNDQQRVFIYDQENQLTSVLVSNSWKSDFVYDGLGRRRVRKEYKWQNGAWVQADEVRYIYDGKLVIEERDRFNNPLVTYTRGTDLSGVREGAGGIGGLLARYDHLTHQPAYYHADAGGNITAMVNSNQALVAKYVYEPFGHLWGQSGPLADANLYRFSSKEVHEKSGLVYYLYRYYDPLLQRWINRYPIGEEGGVNVYQFVKNNAVSNYDPFGLLTKTPPFNPAQSDPADPSLDLCKATPLPKPCKDWQNAPAGEKDEIDCLLCCQQTFSNKAKGISTKNVGWKVWFTACRAKCIKTGGEKGPDLPGPNSLLPAVPSSPPPDMP